MKKIRILLLIFLVLFTGHTLNLNHYKLDNYNFLIQEKKNKENDTIKELDRTIVDTYSASTNVIGQFTTIAKINSLDNLKKYSVIKAKPGSVILYINENINLINENKEELNISLLDVYNMYIKNKMIPIIYIDNIETANNFINYYPYNFNLLDMAIASNNSEVIKTIRKINTSIRGILDCSDLDIDSIDSLIQEANISYCNTIILNNAQASESTIKYIQARLKTIWVEVNEYSTLDILEQINNGASGLICENTDYIYSATNVYLKTDNFLRNLNRMPYNIAHRGVLSNYENSLEGCIEAFEYGATHLEIDIQLTRDNRLAIMHDATIDRTTTGTGSISDYTYDELKQFKIDSSSEGPLDGPGVAIPLLDDFLKYFKEKDVVIVIEFKTTNTKAVNILRETLEKYDAFNKVILISFYPGILSEINSVIPEVPLSSLGSISYADFATGLEYVNNKNSAVNTTKDNAYKDLTRYLIARGFLPWHWTYSDTSEIQSDIVMGAQGLTNDCSESLKDFGYKLISNQEYIEVTSFENLELELKLETYSNSKDIYLDARPLYIQEYENYAYVIFQASYNTTYDKQYTFCVFSNVIKLIKV